MTKPLASAPAGTLSAVSLLAVGDRVVASYNGSENKYPGTIDEVLPAHYAIQFDDGDYDEMVPNIEVRINRKRTTGTSSASKSTKKALSLAESCSDYDEMPHKDVRINRKSIAGTSSFKFNRTKC